MNIRESLNTSKIAGVAVAVVLFGVAGLILYSYLRPRPSMAINSAYYTDDDGQTFFVDSVYRVPPFDHNGKTAVRAMRMTYDDGKKDFVAYLQRFTAPVKKKLDAACAAATAAGKPLSTVREFFSQDVFLNGLEVKKAGPGGTWVPRRSSEGIDIMNTPSPDGSAKEAITAD